MIVAPLPSIASLPIYRAGRSAEVVERETGIANASRLASNESPYGPLPSVRETLAETSDTINRYPAVRAEQLISEIASSFDVPRESVIAGPGSAGLLWQLAGAYLGPGRSIVAPTPSFEGYPLIARLSGASLIQVPLRDHAVHVPDMVEAIEDDTAVVVIAEPNNPTGTGIGADAIEALVDATRERSLLVIDEAYVEFTSNPSRSIEMAIANDHVVVLRTFSKAFGLASLRIGFAIGHPDVVGYIDRVGPPFSVTTHAEAAAIASLRAISELQQRVEAIVSERQRVISAVRAAGIDCLDSDTNFAFLPISDSAEPLAAELERLGVITRPVAGVGLRVTIGSVEDNDRFLGAIAFTQAHHPKQSGASQL